MARIGVAGVVRKMDAFIGWVDIWSSPGGLSFESKGPRLEKRVSHITTLFVITLLPQGRFFGSFLFSF